MKVKEPERVWEKIFGIPYCPINFWETKQALRKRQKLSLPYPLHCPKLLSICCLHCSESNLCQSRVCQEKEEHCEEHRKLPLEAFERAYSKSASYIEFWLQAKPEGKNRRGRG